MDYIKEYILFTRIYWEVPLIPWTLQHARNFEINKIYLLYTIKSRYSIKIISENRSLNQLNY